MTIIRPANVRGIRAVIIPHTAAPLPTINLPESTNDEPEGFADPNNLTTATRERIRQLAQELPSQAAVEKAVFGYTAALHIER